MMFRTGVMISGGLSVLVSGIGLMAPIAMADIGIEFEIPALAGLKDPDAAALALRINDPEGVTKSTPAGFSSPVIKASSAQDAINAAANQLQASGRNGASWIEIDGEIGIVSMGSAPWDSARMNPMLRLREQRLAWMEATMYAKSSMARFVEGASVRANEQLNKELSTRDTETLSQIESRNESSERITSSVSSVLRGATIYSVSEDADAGRVSVTLVSTPGSQSLGQIRNSEITGTRDIQQSLNTMVAEIRSGIVAPTGGRLLENPINGKRAWVAFGSAVVNPQRTGALREAELDSARRTARIRAERAMVSILMGEAISEDDLLDSRYRKIQSRMDDFLAKTSDEKSETLSEQVTESNRKSVANGQLPPNISSFELESPDGSWQYSILVHGLQSDDFKSDAPKLTRPDRMTPAESSPSEEITTPSEASGDQAIITRGTGPTVNMAIKDALMKAISQVNGTLITGDTVSTRKYEDAIKDFDGLTEQSTTSQVISGEMIQTTSGGLVDSYRILEEGSLTSADPEWSQGDRFFARIQSVIPVFDPNDPRPGGRPTIAVLPLALGNIQLPEGDRRLTGTRIADTLTSSMTADLIRNDRYTVLDEKYLQRLDRMRDRILERIRSGQADLGEFLKIGRELTADYVLVGTLEDLTFRQWREYLNVRKTYETRQEVAIDIEMRLINVATGEIEWMKRFDQSWNHLDLMKRSGAERNDSPIQFAVDRALGQIDQSLMSYLNSLPRER
ncbi:MAG: hypothetical protein CMJ40_09245 [Phycisphaerae bacterium]|nr:hypothetical protein [Phycisphaerae bacterium]